MLPFSVIFWLGLVVIRGFGARLELPASVLAYRSTLVFVRTKAPNDMSGMSGTSGTSFWRKSSVGALLRV